MFGNNSRKIEVLEDCVKKLESDIEIVSERYRKQYRLLRDAMENLRSKQIFERVPVWDEDGPTGVKTVVDVSDVVHELLLDLDRELAVQKSKSSYVTLIEL